MLCYRHWSSAGDGTVVFREIPDASTKAYESANAAEEVVGSLVALP